jgi:hypothetical protein
MYIHFNFQVLNLTGVITVSLLSGALMSVLSLSGAIIAAKKGSGEIIPRGCT